ATPRNINLINISKINSQIPNYLILSSPVPGGACAALDAVLRPNNSFTTVNFNKQTPNSINYPLK
ncbi:MAG: hypothetical protein KJN66_05920, partial [Bacteroidia bacterium]|nr:hypothetical protein [Bacteroidia bacterium]